MRRVSGSFVARTQGLTLIEVVIAVSILAVGVLAVFGLQSSALRGTRTATLAQELANIAQSELQLQREFTRHVTAPVSGETCRSGIALDVFTCTVDVLPCDYGGGAITCRNTSIVTAVARQIDVTVTGPNNEALKVSTVVR